LIPNGKKKADSISNRRLFHYFSA